MVELILEANDLILELNDLALAVNKLRLLVLEVVGFGVNQLVEVVNTGQLLGDIILESSGLCGQICTLLALQIILIVELVDLLGVLPISLPQVLEFLFQVSFLRL